MTESTSASKRETMLLSLERDGRQLGNVDPRRDSERIPAKNLEYSHQFLDSAVLTVRPRERVIHQRQVVNGGRARTSLFWP
jgi:hypothetical protein